MNDKTEIVHSHTGVAQRELTGELIQEIQAQKKSGRYTLKFGLPWWQYAYPYDLLVERGVEPPVESFGPFQGYQSILEANGKPFEIPVKAIPEVKALIYTVANIIHSDPEKKPADWNRQSKNVQPPDTFGHLIGSKIHVLQLAGWKQTETEQRETLNKLHKTLEELGGPEIRPLLQELGF